MQALELIARIGLPVAFFALPVAILTISRAIAKRRAARINRAIRAQRLFF